MANRAWITEDTIDASALLNDSASSADGAVLLFLGVVRDLNEGRAVGHLDYQAYPEMAAATLAQILDEASAQWDTGDITAVHRVGRLDVGEPSVAIVVAAPHRGDAYAASRYVIEELKKRVPIWKKEGYLDGESEWLLGTTPEPASSSSDG